MGTRPVPILAATLTVLALAACGTSSENSAPPGPPTEPKPYCEVAVKALALGLQQFDRTEVAGDVLDHADNAASTVCTNAVANFQAGRPVTFELLRPEATPLTVSITLEELTQPPPPVPPPGSSPQVQQRWGDCWRDFRTSNWMVTSCLGGDIDPLTSS